MTILVTFTFGSTLFIELLACLSPLAYMGMLMPISRELGLPLKNDWELGFGS